MVAAGGSGYAMAAGAESPPFTHVKSHSEEWGKAGIL